MARPGRAISLCPLDCPDACALDVTVEDGRVVRVAGSTRHRLTGGFVCAKVAGLPRTLAARHRVTAPLLREEDGGFRPISWQAALDRLAAEIVRVRDRWGGEAILPAGYGGSNGLLTQGSWDARFFHRLGATRQVRNLCAGPSSAAARAIYGRMPCTAIPDTAHARFVAIWGCNPHATGIHLLPFLRRARRAGAFLAVIDPRRTPLAARADLHLPIRPGTDLPLALAVVRRLFEAGWEDRDFLDRHAAGVEALRERAAPWTAERAAEACGVPACDILRLAETYARTSPALIRVGWGLERNRNGASATAAVLALPAVAGKFGVRGGGYILSSSAAWPLDPAAAVGAPPPDTRSVRLSELGRALTDLRDPPVKLLFVYNGNPVATCPDQGRVRRGLARRDLFTVVHDQVMTDTAALADLVLPATCFLEHAELHRSYGAFALQYAEPAASPPGEAWSNQRLFRALCERLGLVRDDDLLDDRELARAIVLTAPGGARAWADLEREGSAEPDPPAPIPFVDVLPGTPDRRIHLAPPGYHRYRPDPATVTAPLALISPARPDQVSSTFGMLTAPAPLAMHPDDAAARGIVDGERVRVWNELGEVRCRVAVTDAVRPGVVSLPKGLWSHHTENGATANALVPDGLSDFGEGPVYNDARVEVEGLGA